MSKEPASRGRPTLRGPDRGDGTPIDLEFRVGIVQWSARIDE